MSFRPRIKQYPAIANGDMSQASIVGAVSVIVDISLPSYAFSWSGSSPSGSITIQVSNDYTQNPDGSTNNAGTWNNIYFYYGGSLVDSVSVSGNTGNVYIDTGLIGAYAIRPVYTKVSGTGSFQATINAKVS